MTVHGKSQVLSIDKKPRLYPWSSYSSILFFDHPHILTPFSPYFGAHCNRVPVGSFLSLIIVALWLNPVRIWYFTRCDRTVHLPLHISIFHADLLDNGAHCSDPHDQQCLVPLNFAHLSYCFTYLHTLKNMLVLHMIHFM